MLREGRAIQCRDHATSSSMEEDDDGHVPHVNRAPYQVCTVTSMKWDTGPEGDLALIYIVKL